jgi:hypothetical protein
MCIRDSLRSVPGVHLADCLKRCDDLLVKYGGHAMAAGVTLTEDRYPAFCERLEQAVAASDPEVFVPAQAYDLALNFEDADVSLLDQLAQLKPYGVDHPAPVFYTGGAQLQTRRACGAGGAHLQLQLRQNKTVLGGIAFGMGAEAAMLPDEVDVAYSLERNEYRGRQEIQCHVSALRPAAYARKRALTQEEEAPYHTWLALRLLEQAGKPGSGAETLCSASAQPPLGDELLCGRQGTLYVAYTRESALLLLSRLEDRVELAQAMPEDPRCFHTLWIRPTFTGSLSPFWRHIVLLDGALSPADEAFWQAQCPNAALIAPGRSPALCRALAALDAGDDAYRALYRLLRKSAFASLRETAQAATLSDAQTLTGLQAFQELGLARFVQNPFSYTLLPPSKCELGNSPLLQFIRFVTSTSMLDE